MSKERAGNAARVVSNLEQQVLNALRGLPSGYDVRTQTQQMKFESEGISDRYEPDIIVSAPDGRLLIIEVKSHHSLSLSNMAKLAAIKRRTEGAGAEFLVLVPDAVSNQPANKMKEFDDLRISYARNPSNIVPAVLDALSETSAI